MQVFQTKAQITKYIKTKEKILQAYGFYCYEYDHDYYGGTFIWGRGEFYSPEYISVLLYSKFVGKGIVKAVQEYRNLPILTTTECGIEQYLIKNKIPHILADRKKLKELK